MVNHRFSPLHHRSWDVPKNISTRTSTWVLVHEYEYKYEYYYFGTHEYEYSTSTRNSVLEHCEYEYPSPAQEPLQSLHINYQGNETSIDIKDSKFVDHLYIDWPVAKR